MLEEKEKLVNSINLLVNDLLKSGKNKQAEYFNIKKNEIINAGATNNLCNTLDEVSKVAPIAQYAGFNAEEERKLYEIIRHSNILLELVQKLGPGHEGLKI